MMLCETNLIVRLTFYEINTHTYQHLQTVLAIVD